LLRVAGFELEVILQLFNGSTAARQNGNTLFYELIELLEFVEFIGFIGFTLRE
jgi:hypothetical protein